MVSKGSRLERKVMGKVAPLLYRVPRSTPD